MSGRREGDTLVVETTHLRHDGPVYEYACHEANYSMTNILQGGRVADALKVAAKK